jgi:DNA-binding FadR family transcriptional regulator
MALHFYLAGMVARLAATARSSRDVTRLGIANAELTTTDMEWTKAMAGLRVFRLTLATASGNSIFSTWTLQLLDQEERLSRALLGSASHHPTIATSSIRRAIVDAISRSDPNAAEHAAGQESNALAIAFGSK